MTSTSIWSSIVPALIGIAGVLIGATATFFINRHQAESRYRREQRNQVYVELFETLDALAEELAKPYNYASSSALERFRMVITKLERGSLRVRVFFFASKAVIGGVDEVHTTGCRFLLEYEENMNLAQQSGKYNELDYRLNDDRWDRTVQRIGSKLGAQISWLRDQMTDEVAAKNQPRVTVYRAPGQ